MMKEVLNIKYLRLNIFSGKISYPTSKPTYFVFPIGKPT